MKSNAQKIRESYKKLLDDCVIHSRTELFEFARSEHPELNYSEGMLTGALKTLTDPGTGYQNVGRARYQKIVLTNNTDRYMDSLIESYISVLQDALNGLENSVSVNPFELLEMDTQDKKRLNRIRSCIDMIKKTIEDIQE